MHVILVAVSNIIIRLCAIFISANVSDEQLWFLDKKPKANIQDQNETIFITMGLDQITTMKAVIRSSIFLMNSPNLPIYQFIDTIKCKNIHYSKTYFSKNSIKTYTFH